MIARRIRGATHVMGAPQGWDMSRHWPCDSLYVRREGDVVCSAWEPTPAEIETLIAGGSIVLRIVGGQPPVSLAVELAEEPVA